MSKYDRCSVCGYSEHGGSNDANPGDNGRVYPRRTPGPHAWDYLCDVCADQIVAEPAQEEEPVDELPLDGEVPNLEQETEYEEINWQEELDGDDNFNRKQPFHDE